MVREGRMIQYMALCITESMWHAYVHYKYKVGRAEVQLALVETQCLCIDCKLERGLRFRASSVLPETSGNTE